ncbi:MAG: winged helix-turn-helix transcriptional regulator [Candidatus Diapherotrites archaeon]|nr:winged helix-turn-helix transcriptional regulator [Candidatus Diapherotrites archaeon]
MEWLIAGTRGGPTRACILLALVDNPLNANRLSTTLKLDYKTVLHHLEKLRKDNLVVLREHKYGGVYAVTLLPEQVEALKRVCTRFGQNLLRPPEKEG